MHGDASAGSRHYRRLFTLVHARFPTMEELRCFANEGNETAGLAFWLPSGSDSAEYLLSRLLADVFGSRAGVAAEVTPDNQLVIQRECQLRFPIRRRAHGLRREATVGHDSDRLLRTEPQAMSSRLASNGAASRPCARSFK